MGPAIQVREDAMLRQVASVMLQRQVDNVVVVNPDGSVRGLVTDRDLTLNERYLRLSAIKVPRLHGHWVTACDAVEAACIVAATMTAGEVMDTRPTTAAVLESIGTVVERMLRRDADYALVLQDGDVVGLLGRRDLLRLVAGQLESHSGSAADNGSVHLPIAHCASHHRIPGIRWLSQGVEVIRVLTRIQTHRT
jgi:CBS domain-containing protein